MISKAKQPSAPKRARRSSAAATPRHDFRHRVGIEEIDAAGVMFGPRIVALAHRAYEARALGHGIDLAALVRAGVHALPLVRVEADFLSPIRHGDELEIAVRCAAIGRSSYRIHCAVRCGGTVAANVVQVHACIDVKRHRVEALPVDVIAALRRMRL
jgi:1,4-dihydroxy-2-naphthoyl-CoA hydrolase